MRIFLAGILLLTGLFYSKLTCGQTDTTSARVHQGYAEASGLATNGTMVPFWLRALQYGTVPLRGSFATGHVGVSSNYRPGRKFDWGYGLEVVGNFGPTVQQVLLPQAYLKAKLGVFEAYAGRKRTITGLVDTLLTSGSYSVSGNALPLPIIQLSTQGFVPIGFTKGIISVNAAFAHGWFENANRKVQNTLYHQGFFYAKIGKPTWPVRFYAGINHQAVWNGYSPYLGNNVSNNGYLPSSLKAYLYVITGLAYPDAKVDPNVTEFDETNRAGNHLGSLDLGAEFEVGNSTIMVYRQNPYDTGALWYLTTIADGLNGLSIRRNSPGTGFFTVDRGLFEFLYTANQGGNVFVINNPKLRGKVDYFNNSQYIDGWTTRAHTIGTPFLTPEGDIRPSIPYGPIINNRVSMVHVGLTGHISPYLTWLMKLSQSTNMGTYNTPLPGSPKQFSGLLQVEAQVNLPVVGPLNLSAWLATDQGELFPNSTAGRLGIRKNWSTRPVTRTAARPSVRERSVSPLFH